MQDSSDPHCQAIEREVKITRPAKASSHVRFLYLGFALLLLAFVVQSMYFYQHFLNTNQSLISQTQNNNAQMSSAMSMRLAIRERAILLWQMTQQQDLFERDNLLQKFYDFGSSYKAAREVLTRTALNQKEQKLLAELDHETSQRAENLRQFADQLIADIGHENYIANLNRVVGEQASVASLIDKMMQLQQEQNRIIIEQTSEATTTLLIQLLVVVSLIIIATVYFARRLVRAAETQNQLLQQANQQLNELAHADFLTGLPNRKALMEYLDTCLALALRHNQHGGLLFIDLDGFKQINDTYGHDIGDQFLIKISQTMKSFRQSDIVARLGGDEFVIVVHQIENTDELTQFAEKLLQRLSMEYDLGAIQVKASASIGICLFPHDSKTANNLLSCADEAMYQAKKSGKNRYCLIEA